MQVKSLSSWFSFYSYTLIASDNFCTFNSTTQITNYLTELKPITFFIDQAEIYAIRQLKYLGLGSSYNENFIVTKYKREERELKKSSQRDPLLLISRYFMLSLMHLSTFIAAYKHNFLLATRLVDFYW